MGGVSSARIRVSAATSRTVGPAAPVDSEAAVAVAVVAGAAAVAAVGEADFRVEDFQAAVGAVGVVDRAARHKAGAEATVTTVDAASAIFRAPSARPIG